MNTFKRWARRWATYSAVWCFGCFWQAWANPLSRESNLVWGVGLPVLAAAVGTVCWGIYYLAYGRNLVDDTNEWD